MKKILPIILTLAAVSLLSVQWAWPLEKKAGLSRQFSDKANLALRQAGHHLLVVQGDRTSTIPPVDRLSENEFSIELKNELNYDTLPFLLAAAFKDYGIASKYHVTIKNCCSDTLILGYNWLAFENENIACKGREEWSDCNKIKVVFENSSNSTYLGRVTLLGYSLVGLLLLASIYFFLKREKASDIGSNKIQELQLGNTQFDFDNQILSINGQKTSLTFRENKLLQYFTNYPNQILEREKILSEVWGDEGIIVGRSLDVFVSRLRKILKEDERMQIKNVHGVGYRLEVN